MYLFYTISSLSICPFFFLLIGLKIDLQALSPALDLGIILLIVAVVGKIIGVAIPVLKMADGKSALLLGISMVPRAEIMMIVMQHGLLLGDWAIPARLFAAMVLVSAVTTIIVPIVLRPLLRQWPQT